MVLQINLFFANIFPMCYTAWIRHYKCGKTSHRHRHCAESDSAPTNTTQSQSFFLLPNISEKLGPSIIFDFDWKLLNLHWQTLREVWLCTGQYCAESDTAPTNKTQSQSFLLLINISEKLGSGIVFSFVF